MCFGFKKTVASAIVLCTRNYGTKPAQATNTDESQ